MPGIGYVTLMEDGSLKGPIDKFLTDEERKQNEEEQIAFLQSLTDDDIRDMGNNY